MFIRIFCHTCKVAICCSMVAVSYIYRQRVLGPPHLCRLAYELWLAAFLHLKSLKAVQGPGLENHAADYLSRGGPSTGEWRLHSERRVVAGMFASRESTNCSQFVSLRRDDSPLEINTLAGQWPKGLLY